MRQRRDLNRTRERILAAAQKEFAAKGFAGARTGALARRARVDERMIFYCFGSKEGLYQAFLRQKLAARANLIESNPEDDFTNGLVKGFAASCADSDLVRVWQWEALDSRKRKLVAEKERRAVAQAEVSRLQRTKLRGALPSDADEEMLMLVSVALRVLPLMLPQATRLITGLDPLDSEFRRKWTICLQWVGERLQASTAASGQTLQHKITDGTAADSTSRAARRPIGTVK